MRTDHISEIDVSGKGHWWPGVFAIEHTKTGKRHYVGTRDVGRRVRDNVNWLNLRVHHNPDLQADWIATPTEFRLVLVEKIAAGALIKIVKQSWIDRDRASACGVYNRKNSVPKSKATPRLLSVIAKFRLESIAIGDLSSKCRASQHWKSNVGRKRGLLTWRDMSQNHAAMRGSTERLPPVCGR